jgi:hypothetical protein
MYEEENRARLRENVVNAVEYMKMQKKKEGWIMSSDMLN